MASLFISYSRKNIESARKLTEAFKGQDLDFWIDWEGIPPTVDWWQEIEKGIEEADIFLFLISPDSCSSKVCKQEIEHAVKNGKRLIPLVVGDVTGEQAPAELSHLNWIFIRESDDFDLAFAKLITAIKTDYAWVQAHRELQVKALEWEKSGHEKSFLLFGKELQDAEHQLATNTSKEPHPTDLQREYVHKSRQGFDRRRVRNAGITTAGLITLAVLAMFGFIQAGLANTNAKKEQAASTLAVSNASTAQAASTLAVSNASTAVANQAEAERQTKIALARQLVAQAQSIHATGDSKEEVAVLLAIKSMSLYPVLEASQVLQNNPLEYPVAPLDHEEWVSSVALSPDGKYVASGGNDTSIRVWDAISGEEVTRMYHNGWVLSVSFSPDGKYIFTGGSDRTVRVWNASLGEEIAQMTQDHAVLSVAFNPNGKFISAEDNTARVWDASTGEEIARMTHDGLVLSVAFSPDGRYAISGGDDNTVRVWNASTGEEIARMRHDNAVRSVASSPSGEYVVSAGDVNVRIWDSITGKEIARMNHGDSVSSVAFSPDGRHVVSGGDDNTVRVWDATTGQEISHMDHGEMVRSVAFSPDGKYVASGGYDNTVRVWDAPKGEEITHMKHDDALISVAFSSDDKYVVSGGYDNTVRVWDASTGEEIIHMNQDDAVISLAFSQDGKYVVSGGDDNTVRVWNVATGEEISRMNHDDAFFSGVISVAFSSDDKYVVSGGSDNTARVWNALTGEEIARMTHDESVSSVAFSPDGKYVVSGGYDSTARVWDASTSEEIARMRHDNAVRSVAFSPDGKYVASGGYDNTVRVWDASTGEEIASMTHDDSVSSIAFSPDGKYVVSGGDDNTVRVWDPFTGEEIVRMPHNESVSSIAFSSDGNYVVSREDDKIARVWHYRPEDLIEESCSHLTRNLTIEEWRRYLGDSLLYQAICTNLPLPEASLQEIAFEVLDQTENPLRLQTAIRIVKDLLSQDENIDNSEDEAKRFISHVVTLRLEGLSSIYSIDSDEDLRQTIARFEDAKNLYLDFGEFIDSLDNVCWTGSLSGYAKDVLKYCEQAVQLSPQDADIRDNRGFARALTGDFPGAIDDFQFYVDHADRDIEFIRQRQQWILALKAGNNPITPEVLNEYNAWGGAKQ